MRNHRLYLRDILDALESIEKFVQDMSFEEFKQDDKTVSAVIQKVDYQLVWTAIKERIPLVKEYIIELRVSNGKSFFSPLIPLCPPL